MAARGASGDLAPEVAQGLIVGAGVLGDDEVAKLWVLERGDEARRGAVGGGSAVVLKEPYGVENPFALVDKVLAREVAARM